MSQDYIDKEGIINEEPRTFFYTASTICYPRKYKLTASRKMLKKSLRARAHWEISLMRIGEPLSRDRKYWRPSKGYWRPSEKHVKVMGNFWEMSK
jgi:hypothetical protein